MAVLVSQSELNHRIEAAYGLLESCRVCPRECEVNRLKNDKLGFCRSGLNAVVSSASPHHGEEPPISGTRGSGTIFFANCNLRCVYCQNYPISQMGTGRERTPGELACQMLWLQEQGCHNLNLVTPTHFVPQILKALGIARERGFNLPIVYNTSGYESLETLRLLDGIVDIYLPDMRYSDDCCRHPVLGRRRIIPRSTGLRSKRCTDRSAIWSSTRTASQSGVFWCATWSCPDGLSGTEGVMKFLAEEISKDVYVSLMSQYFPAYKANASQGTFPPDHRRGIRRSLCRIKDEVRIEERLGAGLRVENQKSATETQRHRELHDQFLFGFLRASVPPWRKFRI